MAQRTGTRAYSRKRYARRHASAHDATHRLLSCSHASLCPHLYVRAAEPEDFDDLIPIFNSQSEVLKTQYGAHDFFLAELIEAQNEHQKCLVAVVDGHAVGLMSLSSQVELGVLKECFDVGAYDGLDNAFAIALFCVAPSYASRSPPYAPTPKICKMLISPKMSNRDQMEDAQIMNALKTY